MTGFIKATFADEPFLLGGFLFGLCVMLFGLLKGVAAGISRLRARATPVTVDPPQDRTQLDAALERMGANMRASKAKAAAKPAAEECPF